MKRVLAAFLLMTVASPAIAQSPAEELTSLISCHQGLLARSDGTSAEMITGAATPFAFQALQKDGSVIYFVTARGISVLRNSNNKFNGKRFIVELDATQPDDFSKSGTEAGGKIKRTVDISPRGTLGSVCCENAKGAPDAPLVSALDESSIAALKNEIATRLGTVKGSYQNGDPQMHVIDALKKCQNINLPKSAPSISKLIEHYEKLFAKKDGGYHSGKSSKGSDAK